LAYWRIILSFEDKIRLIWRVGLANINTVCRGVSFDIFSCGNGLYDVLEKNTYKNAIIRQPEDKVVLILIGFSYLYL
jgi:hypothetical protein